jgi:hypothetical protein
LLNLFCDDQLAAGFLFLLCRIVNQRIVLGNSEFVLLVFGLKSWLGLDCF